MGPADGKTDGCNDKEGRVDDLLEGLLEIEGVFDGPSLGADEGRTFTKLIFLTSSFRILTRTRLAKPPSVSDTSRYPVGVSSRTKYFP